MKYITELRDIIEYQLENLTLPNVPKNLYDPIRYILSIGGNMATYIVLASALVINLAQVCQLELPHCTNIEIAKRLLPRACDKATPQGDD